jgi:hypothetical protein
LILSKTAQAYSQWSLVFVISNKNGGHRLQRLDLLPVTTRESRTSLA